MTAIDASLPKKERILIAAEDVFSRRGYTKATLDEIIALADTGKGTLYKYFGNKDNLFYTLIEEKHSHLMDELHSLTATRCPGRKKNAFCATTKFCGRKFTYWQQFCRTGRKAAI